MIKIKQIHTTDVHYLDLENLMQIAFPEQERRNKEEQRLYTDTNKRFHCCAITNNEKFIGLITHWDFEEFLYIEHFAIVPSLRNNGYGKEVLGILKGQNQKPIVLEAEEPNDEISIRRIGFYQREGFILHEQPYLQPPYRKEDKWFPLKLMTYGNIDMKKMYNHIKEQIYKEVYQI